MASYLQLLSIPFWYKSLCLDLGQKLFFVGFFFLFFVFWKALKEIVLAASF